MTTAPLKSF